MVSDFTRFDACDAYGGSDGRWLYVGKEGRGRWLCVVYAGSVLDMRLKNVASGEQNPRRLALIVHGWLRW